MLHCQNENEVEACVLLAKELEAKNKEYRIISPYAPQTGLILKRLKEEEMEWKDKCFNVDSFQGNEADYIIISLVRTVSSILPFWCFTDEY
jgi:superfamily I DNA and/or RNA helicase